MAVEILGYRRLYDSLGCELENFDEYLIERSSDDLGIRIYFGPKPKLGIQYNKRKDQFVIPGEETRFFEGEIMGDASKSSYPRNFFTEIICTKELEVPDELSDSFHSNEEDSLGQMLSLAKGNHEEFINTANMVAGIIGLRFHRQFTLELISENFFCIKSTEEWPFQIESQPLEILDGIILNTTGMRVLESNIELILSANVKPKKYASTAFSWLLRAWRDRDPISKFFSLFIPIEIALIGRGGDSQEEQERKDLLDKVIELISKHGGADEKELLDFLQQLSGFALRPSLSARFKDLAEEASIPGWENDIVAFNSFNKMRNNLIHRGDPDISLSSSISDQEVRTLEDIAERYVNWVFFRDYSVYKSRFRPERNQTMK